MNRNYDFEFKNINKIKYKINKFGFINFYLPEEMKKKFKNISIIIDNLIMDIEIRNCLKTPLDLIDIYSKKITFFGKEYSIKKYFNIPINDSLINHKKRIIILKSKNELSRIQYEKEIMKIFKQEILNILMDIIKNKSNKNIWEINYKKINDKKIINNVSIVWNQKNIIEYKNNKLYINCQILYFNPNLIYNIILFSIIFYHNKNYKTKINLKKLKNFNNNINTDLNKLWIIFFENFTNEN